jgi:hypothetical protein
MRPEAPLPRLRLNDLVHHRRVDRGGGHIGRVAAVGPQRTDEIGRVPLVRDGGQVGRDGDKVVGQVARVRSVLQRPLAG